MITVPEAARRVGRNPETVRRWIREGKLRSQKVGTQHLVDEAELVAAAGDCGDELPAPEGWYETTLTGEPFPDVVAAVRRLRRES